MKKNLFALLLCATLAIQADTVCLEAERFAERGGWVVDSLFIDQMAKAKACLENRDYVTGGDVQAVFRDVCAHRVLLKENVRETTVERVLDGLLKQVENPDRRGLFAGMKK